MISLSTLSQASIGDRSPSYQHCLTLCTSTHCTPSTSPPSTSPFSSYHSSPLWSCTSTCQYACQQSLTEQSLDSTEPLEGLPLKKQVQFHGKWPFHRLDLSHLPFPLYLVDYFLPRAQEPLSVLFSIGNLWAHYQGFIQLNKLSKSGGGDKGARTVEGRKLAKVYLVYSMTGLNAWVASTIFHTRDVGWTEKLDYFGAAATTLVGLWSCIIRIRGWYTSPPPPEAKRLQPILSTSLSLIFLFHISYLGLRPRFDYGYNLKFNILFSLSTISIWLFWIFRQSTLPSPSNFSRRQLSSYPSARTRFRAPHHLDPLLPLVLLPLLTALELLDFPPLGPFGLRLLDAHALWHLSTIPVVKMWYQFLIRDVRWIDGQGDPPTAANSNQRSKDTPSLGREGGGGGGLKGLELRRGNLGEGMMGFGLGVLDKYGLGLGGKKARGSKGNNSERNSAAATTSTGDGKREG
ncbi:hypothetical protein JCM5353_008467 [Sporobolomyces roseus]